jgi:hypothetical protein
VATTTIQELLCGPLCRCQVDSSAPDSEGPGDSGDSDETPPPTLDAGGPRIDPNSVEISGEEITFSVSISPLLKASADPRGVSVTAFDTRDGWIPFSIKTVKYNTTEKRVTVELRDAPGDHLIRLIVRGTGAFPFLGRNRIPLAGALDDPAGNQFDGNDFVYMFRARS